MKKQVVLAVAISVVGVSALLSRVTMADAPAKSQWDGVYTAAQAKRGDTLYQQYCLMCHGGDLLGGEMAPPLVGGTFQSNWNDLALDELFERIRGSMPANAPGSLSREQVADILAYMLSKDSFPEGKTELSAQAGSLKETKFLSKKP